MRSLAERNRAKKRQVENEMTELNEEKKLDRKLRQGKITKEEYDESLENLYKKYEYPVQQNKRGDN